jgi:hypothetical protein
MKLIYRVPVLGSVALYIWHIVGIVLIPVVSKLGGYRKLTFGSSIVWTPENRRESIIDGFDFLQSTDKKMFNCITAEGRFVFFYTAGKCSNFGGRYYGLEEQFVGWGREGIAVFLVQSILMREAVPTMNKVNLKQGAPALRLVAPRVVEWMRAHSFRADFIEGYCSAAHKRENDS